MSSVSSTGSSRNGTEPEPWANIGPGHQSREKCRVDLPEDKSSTQSLVRLFWPFLTTRYAPALDKRCNDTIPPLSALDSGAEASACARGRTTLALDLILNKAATALRIPNPSSGPSKGREGCKVPLCSTTSLSPGGNRDQLLVWKKRGQHAKLVLCLPPWLSKPPGRDDGRRDVMFSSCGTVEMKSTQILAFS